MQLLRLRDVLKIVPVSKATWYTMLKQPNAPKTIRLGPNTVAWEKSDIERWLKQKVNE